MATPRRQPEPLIETMSPRARYRSSSFSSDIPIGSPSSNVGGSDGGYLAPMGVTGSPTARPIMPHSASLPSMLGQSDEGPFGHSRSRRSSLSSEQGTSTPTRQKSTYNHPYLIHSSSSAVLSRTNTSPVVTYTALPPATPGHRSSRSMGFLRNSQSVDDLRSPEKAGSVDSQCMPPRGDGKAKGGSSYTAYTPPVRRKLVNRYSVSNLSDIVPREGSDTGLERESERKTGKLDMGVWEWKMGVKADAGPTRELPSNPKLWNAHETAHYVAHCLSHGINPNPDSKTGITRLPPLVIQDITEWIKRGRVTGKGFLMGGEGSWASSSKPPPFLDVLLSLSRNLRRASLKGNIAGISWSTPSVAAEAGSSMTMTSSAIHARDTSVLEEANEEDDEEEEGDGQPSSNVKRLARDFDTRSISSMSTAGSEISEDDMLDRVRPRAGRTLSTTSQQSQRSRDELTERAQRFERGLAEIDRQPAHRVGAKFGYLVDTVRDDTTRNLWDQAVAEGGLRPVMISQDSAGHPPQASIAGAIEGNRETIGLGIFDAPCLPESTDKRAERSEEGGEKPTAITSPRSPFISPPPAYTSPQFSQALAAGDTFDATADDSVPTTSQPPTAHAKHPSYGSLARSDENSIPSKPRLPTTIDRRITSLAGSSNQPAETPSETDTEDSCDLGRRVTLRPARVLSAIFAPSKRGPSASIPAREPEHSPCATPNKPHPAETRLSQAEKTIDELQERLRATELEIARLELVVKETTQPIASAPSSIRDERKDAAVQSNHQALAFIYGGLAGLCMSVLILKTFGRKAGFA